MFNYLGRVEAAHSTHGLSRIGKQHVPSTGNTQDLLDLVNFFICTLVFMVHIVFYILTKGYIAPGNRGSHDKLNQILFILVVFQPVTDMKGRRG